MARATRVGCAMKPDFDSGSDVKAREHRQRAEHEVDAVFYHMQSTSCGVSELRFPFSILHATAGFCGHGKSFKTAGLVQPKLRYKERERYGKRP